MFCFIFSVYSNNLSFGINSDFSWLLKYTKKSADVSNVGTCDIFDPLSEDVNRDGKH